MALKCELPGGLLKKCDKPASGVCRWCGRAYCSNHRSIPITEQPVCTSEDCTAKEAFATTARAARQKAQAHNKEGLCGLPACGNRLPGATCRVCGSEYCPSHLNARLFRVPNSSPEPGKARNPPKKVRFFICDQCIGLVDRYGIVELPAPPEP